MLRPFDKMELKRGILSVYGMFLWREREVVVTKGQIAIYRRSLGTMKHKINLWDPHVRITFVANEPTLTISLHQEDIVLDCKTPVERDAWLGAIYSAQADPPKAFQTRPTLAQDEESDTDSDFENFQDETETLREFQHARSSIIFDVGQLSREEINLVLLPTTQSLDALAQPANTVNAPPSKLVLALATYVERTEGGSRIVLLHWDVLVSLRIGLSLSKFLTLLAERQGSHTSTVSSITTAPHRKASLTHKTNVSNFVRDLLFHPLYSQRLRSDEAVSLSVIDAHFPHCRLRRFSHTDDDLPKQTLGAPALVRKCSGPASSSSTIVVDWGGGKKHAFPSIVMSGISLAKLQPSHGHSFSSVLPLRAVMATYKMSPLSFAQQCTLFHHAQLTGLPLWSFLVPTHYQKDISESFNRLTCYLVWSVLAEDSPSDRAAAIEAITSTAMAASAKSVNNFHLVMACIGCLGDTPLMPSRLPLTWKKVKAKTKAQLHELRALCDYTGGFETLRRKQSLISATCPSLPFLGIIGASLERLKSSPYVTNDSKQPLNFDRLERQYHALHVVENAMTSAFPMTPHPDVQHLLATLPQQLHFVSSKMLQLRSMQLQGYETSATSIVATTSAAAAAAAPTRRVSITNESARLLTFRASCVLWHRVACPNARLKILVEAMAADDKSPVARLISNLHRDVRASLFASSCPALCLVVSQGLDGIFRAAVDTHGSECMEMTGWDETTAWQTALYEALVECVYGPVAQSVQAKLQAEHREVDLVVRRRLEAQTAQTLVHYTMFNPLNQLALTGQTPIAMLRLLSAIRQELNATDEIATKQLRSLVATSTATTPHTTLQFISSTIDLTKCSAALISGFDLFKKCLVVDEPRS
ncbi:hypothetical protein AeRB84_000746 [Aphanomyces euteiches]|nr:hypothetical protein AeRB84_000746 [Aphanomyces euteiches]